MSSRWAQAAVLVGVAIASASAVAVASVVLGGGPDSASKVEYEATVVNARDRVELALKDIGKPQSLEEIVAELQQASASVNDVAVDLSNSGVADGFEDEHDKLVDALVGLSTELQGTAATIGDPNFTAALPHLSSLSFPQWTVVNRILRDMKRQGIDVQPLVRH